MASTLAISAVNVEESLVDAIPCKKIVEEKEGTHKSRSESENESKLCCTNISNGTQRNHVKQKNTSTDVSFNQSGRSSFGHLGEHDRLQGRDSTTEMYSMQNTEPTQPNISNRLRTDENVILEREVTSQSFEKKHVHEESKCRAYCSLEQKEKIQKHRNLVEPFLDEILGMFDRSKLPENEKPRNNETLEINVCDKIAEELYAIDASVKSCWYRFGTLQVFVDDPCNDEIKKNVVDVLTRNNIKSYEIVPSIRSFKPLHKVGAKVHPNNSYLDSYGSLAGFAKKNEKDLVALMSRHVAIHSPDRNVLLRDGHKQIRAKIIPETLPPQESQDNILDISAAEVQPIDIEKCDTRFKTEAGELTTGKQCSYEQLRSRQVHLWGSTTSPGLGIITRMPRIRDRDKDNTNIIVENRQNTNALRKSSSKSKEEHSVVQKLHTDINIESEKENISQRMQRGGIVQKPEQAAGTERLYGEKKDMFTRSRVSKDEQPLSDNQFDGIVHDKLKQDLKQITDQRILNFNVDSTTAKELSSCNVDSSVAANFHDGTVTIGQLELSDKIERLCHEINGMLEKPHLDVKFDGNVSDAVKQDLRQINASIRSCEYHCSTFVVFVDNGIDQETLKPDIKRVLNKHNIFSFIVVPTTVKELSYFNVRSAVAVNCDDGAVKYGTQELADKIERVSAEIMGLFENTHQNKKFDGIVSDASMMTKNQITSNQFQSVAELTPVGPTFASPVTSVPTVNSESLLFHVNDNNHRKRSSAQMKGNKSVFKKVKKS